MWCFVSNHKITRFIFLKQISWLDIYTCTWILLKYSDLTHQSKPTIFIWRVRGCMSVCARACAREREDTVFQPLPVSQLCVIQRFVFWLLTKVFTTVRPSQQPNIVHQTHASYASGVIGVGSGQRQGANAHIVDFCQCVYILSLIHI